MNRIDRLNAILIQLQSKKIVKAKEIADRFDISLRTVYRDIRALEQNGVPIGSEAGVGYFLSENYSLPPISFTSDEATALMVAEKLMAQQSDRQMRMFCESALMKIKSVLRSEEKERLDTIQKRIKLLNTRVGEDSTNSFFNQIQEAIGSSRVISIKYIKKGEECTPQRSVEPIGLCSYGERWHMIAWCKLRDDYRDFRLDRIQNLSITDQKFEEKHRLTIEEYLQQQYKTEEEPNIQLQIPVAQTGWLNQSKHWWGFLYETHTDEYVNLYFYQPNIEMFAAWLLGTGCKAEIITPKVLHETVLRFIAETNEHYQTNRFE